jgi:hypothetical protein
MTYIAATITADTPTPIDVTGTLGDPELEAAINEFAAAYQTDVFEIELTPETDAMIWHVEPTINGESVVGEPGTTVSINWGDGVGEIADEANEGHPYQTPGRYDVTVRLMRAGEPSLERIGVAVASGSSEPVEPPPENGEPPEGTIEEVKAWVGDDPDRAQQALDAEEAGQQRQTLMAWLEGKL